MPSGIDALLEAAYKWRMSTANLPKLLGVLTPVFEFKDGVEHIHSRIKTFNDLQHKRIWTEEEIKQRLE